MLLRLAPFFLLSLLVLAGCSPTSSHDASEKSATETRTPQDTLVVPTATITANEVTLSTDRASYTPGDQVRVTIANGRSASIYAIASKVNCTALDVQVKMATGWQTSNVAPCGAQGDPQTVEIKPGSATSVTLTAPSTRTYRCALQYTTINIPPPRSAPNGAIADATNPASGPATTVYSNAWEVKSA
jgi:hypothetical protein